MIQAEVNQEKTISFYLTEQSSDSPVTGATDSDISPIYVRKEGGSPIEVTLDGTNFREVDSSNMPGVYEIDLSSNLTDTLGELIVFIDQKTVGGVTVERVFQRVDVVPEHVDVDFSPVTNELDDIKGSNFTSGDDDLHSIKNEVETGLDELDKKTARLLGLSHENVRIDNHNYDQNGNLVQSTMKIYPTRSDLIVDDNEIAEYTMLASYDGDDNLVDYVVRKE